MTITVGREGLRAFEEAGHAVRLFSFVELGSGDRLEVLSFANIRSPDPPG